MRHHQHKRIASQHDVRSEVTSVIAHQLKTPLVGIKSSLEVALSGQLGALNAQQEEYLHIALDEVSRMVFLVKDLLDAARIDQKELELNTKLTDVVQLVKNSIDNVAAFARATNTEISFTTAGDIPLIKVDSTKIQQVINNIIDNALRYMRGKGRVKIMVRKEGPKIIFSCEDNGIGLTKTEGKNIFSKFYRTAKAIELVPMGSGLGLFIAKAIVEQSGGRIWFTSTAGRGSIFSFSLPVKLDNKRR